MFDRAGMRGRSIDRLWRNVGAGWRLAHRNVICHGTYRKFELVSCNAILGFAQFMMKCERSTIKPARYLRAKDTYIY
jgi:hypothetical protein